MPILHTQDGRSMVEMLGVLAIIGMLSVGSIAGYSKAMFKYRLNKQSEQLATVIRAGLRYAHAWNFSTVTNTTPYFIEMGEIPNEMIRKDDHNRIWDVFNTEIKFQYEINSTHLFVALDTSSGARGTLDICRNFVQTAQAFHSEIWYIAQANRGSTDEPSDKYSFSLMYGDVGCSKDRVCLKNINAKQIGDFCRFNFQKNGHAHLKVVWKE